MPWPPYPQGRDHGTHWTGGWVDLRAGLDMLMRKIPSCCGEMNCKPG